MRSFPKFPMFLFVFSLLPFYLLGTESILADCDCDNCEDAIEGGTVLRCEDFQSFRTQDLIAEASDCWKRFGNSSADARISRDIAFDSGRAMEVKNGGGIQPDVLFNLTQAIIDNSKHQLSFRLFVANNSFAYFDMQSSFDNPTGGGVGRHSITFKGNGEADIKIDHTDRNRIERQFNYNQNQWLQVVQIFERLPNNQVVVSLEIDGLFIHQWDYDADQIEGISFWAQNSQDNYEFYVDNICFSREAGEGNNDDDCFNPINLNCNVLLKNQNTGTENNLLNYVGPNCNHGGLEGADDVYSISKDESDYRLTVNVFNDQGLDLFIFNNCNGPTTTDCISSGLNDGSDPVSVVVLDEEVNSDNYLLALDAFNASVTNVDYDIIYTCGSLDCFQAQPISCGGSRFVNIEEEDERFKSGEVSAYKKGNVLRGGYTGNERVFFFDLDSTETVTIDLTNDSPDAYFEVFLLQGDEFGECDEYNVVDWTYDGNFESGANQQLIVENLEQGTYFIVIDGFRNAYGQYTVGLDWGCNEGFNICDLGGIFLDNGINTEGKLDTSDYRFDLLNGFGCTLPQFPDDDDDDFDDFGFGEDIFFEVYTYYYSKEDSATGNKFNLNDLQILSDNDNDEVTAFLIDCSCGDGTEFCCLDDYDGDQQLAVQDPYQFEGYYTIIIAGTAGTEYSFKTIPESICYFEDVGDNFTVPILNTNINEEDVEIFDLFDEDGDNDFVNCSRINDLIAAGFTVDDQATCREDNENRSVYQTCYDGYRLYTGPDAVYKFRVTGSDALATITLSSEAEMGVFLYDEQCGERCLGYAETQILTGDTAVISEFLTNGEYYLIVDKNENDNSTSQFTLTVDLVESDLSSTRAPDSSCKTLSGDNGKHVVSVRGIRQLNFGGQPIYLNSTDKNFNIQFHHLNENNDLRTNKILNWNPNLTKYDIYGDDPSDGEPENGGRKCSYEPGESFDIRFVENRIGKGRAKNIYKVDGFFRDDELGQKGKYFPDSTSTVSNFDVRDGEVRSFMVKPPFFRVEATPTEEEIIQVLVSGDWNIIDTLPEWVKIDTSQYSGNGQTDIEVNFDPNPGNTIRRADIIIEGPGNSIDTVEVFQAGECTNPPLADLQVSSTSDSCSPPFEFELDISGSTFEPGIGYEWTGPNGLILDQKTIENAAPGTYTLIVKDTIGAFRCADTTFISIPEKELEILETIVENITCDNILSAVQINVEGGVGPYFYEMDTTGNFLPGDAPNEFKTSTEGTYNLRVADQLGCFKEAQFTIEANNTTPEVIISGNRALACEGDSITLTTEVDQDVSYAWFKKGENESLGTESSYTVKSIGEYLVEVKNNETGCSNEAEVDVIQDDNNLTVSINTPLGTILNCKIDSILLQVDPSDESYSFEWSRPNTTEPANNDTIIVRDGGIYAVTITDTTTGCRATDAIEIAPKDIESPVAIIESSQGSENCDSEQITLRANTTQNEGKSLNYVWELGDRILNENNPSASTIDVNENGTYTLKVIDTGNKCSTVTQSSISLDILPTVTLNASSTVITCSSGAGILIDGSNSSQGEAFTYQWELNEATYPEGDDQMAIEVSEPGTYRLILTNTVQGCTAFDEITITENFDTLVAQVSPQAPVINCISDSIELKGKHFSHLNTNAKYQWIYNDSIVGKDTSLFAKAPGMYILQITNEVNNCISRDTVEVKSDEIIPEFAINSSLENFNCNDTIINLSAVLLNDSGDFDFNWSDDTGEPIGTITSSNITINQPGNYSLSVLNKNNGCNSDQITKNIGVTLPPNIVVDEVKDVSCSGKQDGAILVRIENGHPDFLYLWSNGSQEPALDSLSSQDYQLTITDSDNCQDTITIKINEPTPLRLTMDPIITTETAKDANDGSIQLEVSGGTPEYEIIWSDSLRGAEISGLPPKDYEYQVIDKNGCTIEGKVTVFTFSMPKL